MTRLRLGGRARGAVIVCMICGSLGAAVSPALAAPATWVNNGWKTSPDAWGVNDVALSWGDMSDAQLATRVAAIKKVKATWVRYAINWAQIQAGGPGSYNFAATDRMVARLALYGIRWRPMLLDPPPWATAEPAFPMRQPAKSSAIIAEFLYVFMARYGPGGSLWTANRGWLPAMPVQDVELHNEPNGAHYWGVDPATWNFRTDYTGEAYAKLYGEALDMVKPLLPTTRFWMGGLVIKPSSPGVPADYFMRNAFAAHPSLRNTLHGVGLHVYPYSGSPSIASHPLEHWPAIGQLVTTMRTVGRSDMQVQLNEIGASLVNHPDEQNRNDIMRTQVELARSNCPIFGMAAYTGIDWETPDNPMHWYGLVSPTTGALYSHGEAWASRIADFNAGTPDGAQLKIC